MEKIRGMTAAELTSADRGHRPARGGPMDLLALLALGDLPTADHMVRGNPGLVAPAGGVLHLTAKRGDVRAAKWLLDHGADPSARWAHWDSDVTPLHVAILGDHADVVRLLLAGGGDPTIRDTKHDSDAMGWAEFFRRSEIVEILKGHASNTGGRAS
jgi:hypothetical protein